MTHVLRTGSRRWCIGAVLLALVGLVGVAPAGAHGATAGGSLPSADVAFINDVANQALADGAPGVTVIVESPRGGLTRSWGKADLVTRQSLTPTHHMRIGSVTKTYVATALLRLVDQRRVRLADPLSRYVAGIPNGDQITIRQVLGMRSGVFDYTKDQAFIDAFLANLEWPGFGPNKVLEIIRRNAPAFPPGERTEYSNSNYVLAGLIIERVTGWPVASVLRSTVLAPLGLSHTSLPATSALPSPYAHGYGSVDPVVDMTRSNPAVPWTSGGMVSTAPELARWVRALVDGSLLSPQLQAERLATTDGYGLGIIRAGSWLGHGGAIPGYSSAAYREPDTGTTIVVLVNSLGSGPTAEDVFGVLAEQFLPGSTGS